MPNRPPRTWPLLLLAFLLGAGVPAVRALVFGLPLAHIHDEFSYLLGADTLLHGRLANPTPAAPGALQTFHVLLEPVYTSKYPPGQAAIIALGWGLTGLPAAGIWLGDGLFAAALAWLLLAILPPRAALLTTMLGAGWMLFCGVHVIPGYWSLTWWGGAVAAAAGALALGAALRIRERPRFGLAFAVGAGLVGLSFTRPFEGAAAGIAVILACGLRLLHPRVFSGIAVALGLGAALHVAYNLGTTGSWSTMPYAVYEAANATVGPFAWSATPPPRHFRYAELDGFGRWLWAVRAHRFESANWLSRVAGDKWSMFRDFYLPLAAWPLLLGVPRVWRDPRFRRSVGVTVAVVGANALCRFEHPHYFAPLAGAVVATLALAAKGLWRGPWRVIVFASVFGLAVDVARGLVRDPGDADDWAHRRQQIAAELSQGGPALVFVDYAHGHSIHDEWVYNGAELSEAPVIWARGGRPEDEAALVAAWPERKVARVLVGARTAEIEP